MPKKPISVTLEESNLVWLKGVTERSGARSISETLDLLVTSARARGTAPANASRSVVGSIDIGTADAALDDADRAVRDLFARSLSRPMVVKEARETLRPSRKRHG
jgi:hypothetical protein